VLVLEFFFLLVDTNRRRRAIFGYCFPFPPSPTGRICPLLFLRLVVPLNLLDEVTSSVVTSTFFARVVPPTCELLCSKPVISPAI